MTIQINSYNTGVTSSTAGRTPGTSLSMDDFLQLLAAQLANQDALNPSTDTEFISQMAQFTSLQAMQTMSEVVTPNMARQ
jgi:flagellar basal-body rod modification protein FlgD